MYTVKHNTHIGNHTSSFIAVVFSSLLFSSALLLPQRRFASTAVLCPPASPLPVPLPVIRSGPLERMPLPVPAALLSFAPRKAVSVSVLLAPLPVPWAAEGFRGEYSSEEAEEEEEGGEGLLIGDKGTAQLSLPLPLPRPLPTEAGRGLLDFCSSFPLLEAVAIVVAVVVVVVPLWASTPPALPPSLASCHASFTPVPPLPLLPPASPLPGAPAPAVMVFLLFTTTFFPLALPPPAPAPLLPLLLISGISPPLPLPLPLP